MATQISIVIPIYNAAATLRAAVESVLAQDVPDMELLLVDDGSTDATAVLCHALSEQDRRVRVLTQKNAGICAARNRGSKLQRGSTSPSAMMTMNSCPVRFRCCWKRPGKRERMSSAPIMSCCGNVRTAAFRSSSIRAEKAAAFGKTDMKRFCRTAVRNSFGTRCIAGRR